MPRLLLAAATAALATLTFAGSARAECPSGQTCEPNPTYKTPTTSITSGPTDPTTDVTPDFVFSSDLTSVRYECRWGNDNEPWTDTGKFGCAKNYTSPAKQNGTYYLYVRACKDYIDNELGDITKCDATPSKYGFVLNATGPTATFAATSTFDNLRTNTSPKYDLQGGVAYQCSLDDPQQLFACTSPYQINGQGGLGQGEHVVRVRAADEAGNWGPIVSRRFTWDSQGPDFSLGGPALTSDTTPELTWTAPPDGGGAYKVTCKVDDTTIPCDNGTAQVTTALADGDHTFRVSGTDSIGNTSSTSRGLDIDTVAPEVRDLVWDQQARSLAFTTSEDAATFCDDAACTSPWTPKGLTPGQHVLSVRAVDFAGNAGAPATITVTVPKNEQPPPAGGGGGQKPPPGSGGTTTQTTTTAAPVPSGTTPPATGTPRTTVSNTAKKKPAVKKKTKCRTVKTKKGKKKKVCTAAKKKAKKKKR
jgi:hypothetical protein